MDEFQIGDKVEITCQGLAMLRNLMKQMGEEVKPNHHGTVKEIWDDGMILVEFPIGDDDPEEHSQVAPYPAHMVKHRK